MSKGNCVSLQNGGSTDLTRHLRVLAIGIPALYAVLLALFWNRVGPHDFDEELLFAQLQFWNERLFGLARQWSPVFCSGVSLAAHPQIPFLSLGMLFGYLLGPLAGLKFAQVLYLACGWAGTYLYARLWSADRRVQVLAASLFIGNGFFILRFAAGHVDFWPVLALPLMLWALHQVTQRPPLAVPGGLTLRHTVITLLLAAAISLTIDSAPVSFLHLHFWVGLYALTLSVVERRARPMLVFILAAALAAVLDAGYVWPMVVGQQEFPRHLPETFTNPLAFLWFLLLPLQGKLIVPANGNGHELSVFIGPVIAWVIWRYRRALFAEMPRPLRVPLCVVSAASLWLGMGSLHLLQVPVALSPFDWLRPLPGFRSMGVTGRYWGFLALPLSLFGAAALYRFAEEWRGSARARAAILFAILLQLGFQGTAILLDWLPSATYEATTRPVFARDGETIRFGYCHPRAQVNSISPRDGIIDCYDMDDFRRAHMEPGTALIRSSSGTGGGLAGLSHLQARFLTWNRIRIVPDTPASATSAAGSEPVEVVLNQAYHRYWHAPGCEVRASRHGNLALRCPAARLAQTGIDLTFDDPVSDLGARVSILGWLAWLPVTGGLLFVIAWQSWRRRVVRAPVTAAQPWAQLPPQTETVELADTGE